MRRPWWLAASTWFVAALHKADCATVRESALRGDDDGGDGDAGGMSGLGGALASMMGGGLGGGGSEGADSDDDPNMVGGKKSGSKGIDLKGLENGLASGGIGQLTSMLTAMRASQSHSDNHIKKGANGEDMYDFRDLDDGFTTPKPIQIVPEQRPMATVAPAVAVPIPAAPSIALPGKHGEIRGLKAAEAAVAATQPTDSKLVVWPPPQAAQVPVAAMALSGSNAAPTAVMNMNQGIGAAPIASNLYQGLALMRQNMDMLMNQAAALGAGNGGNNGGSAGPLAARLDQMSRNFVAEEKKLETKVEVLETDNRKIKEQLQEQAEEIKDIKSGRIQKANKSQEAPDAKKLSPSSAMKAGSYATKPWDATFAVHLDGKAGGKEDTFTIRVHPEWAPEGAKRFQDIVQDGLLQDARFFRVVPHFMVQFGIPASPKVAAIWEHKRIPDDPVTKSNTRGMLTFATSGPNSRTTQLFINYANNDFLDKQGFAPFAEVLADGMKVVDRIQGKYKEKPNQGKIQHHGNKYLIKHFPDLSFVDHVESTLATVPKPAGFLQDSKAPAEEEHIRKAYKYKGIATFFHQKRKASN